MLVWKESILVSYMTHKQQATEILSFFFFSLTRKHQARYSKDTNLLPLPKNMQHRALLTELTVQFRRDFSFVNWSLNMATQAFLNATFSLYMKEIGVAKLQLDSEPPTVLLGDP